MPRRALSVLIGCGLLVTACKTVGEHESTLRDEGSAEGRVPTARRQLTGFECPASGQVKVAFFDADSTLRISRSGSPSANGRDDVYLLPFVADKVRELTDDGYLLAIVSNQGGVPQHVAFEDAEGALLLAARLAASRGGSFHYVDMATRDDPSSYRKPRTGMAQGLERALAEACPNARIDKDASFMVGDAGYQRGVDGPHPDGRPADDFSNSDRLFAEAYGVRFLEPNEFFGWREFAVYNFHEPADLMSFVAKIEAEAKDLEERGFQGERSERLKREAALLSDVNPFPKSYTFVHYNIRELKTSSLVDQSDVQVRSAARTLALFRPDFVSINEIQYDKPDVPSPGTPGTGRNMERLLARAGLGDGWHVTFAEGLTGRAARRLGDSYADDPNSQQARELVDQVNFGSFPGQYSTGFASRFEILRRAVYPEVPENPSTPLPEATRVRWRDWNPSLDFSRFQTADGRPHPSGAELFDKNFNDSLVEIDGKRVHFITFHAVPAFDFGNARSPNLQRNADQLDFLAWYLTGRCEPQAASPIRRCETAVRPLHDQEAEPRFIAVGDLNVDVKTDKPGAKILRRLIFDSGKLHKRLALNYDPAFRSGEDGMSHVTYFSNGLDLGRLQEQLDYFLVSKNLEIDALFVYTPKTSFTEGRCHTNRNQANQALSAFQNEHPNLEATLSRRYEDEDRPWCVIGVDPAFKAHREGSDHLPVVLKFRVK